jgi:hypothetical protein
MADKSLHKSGSTPTEPNHPLTDRVRARVAEVGLALDRRARASGVRAKRPRKTRGASLAAVPAQSPEATREARSIRVVFHELGDAHRQYRLRTGQRVPEALRDAARAFKQAPSLTALVPVAAFLDEAGILSW